MSQFNEVVAHYDEHLEMDVELVDGVRDDSAVKRRVFAKTAQFKAAMMTYDPDRHPVVNLQTNQTQWLAAVESKFSALIDALGEVGGAEGILQGDFEDVEKMMIFMTNKHSDFILKYTNKCLSAPPAAQAAPAPRAAGLAPGLVVPPPGGLAGASPAPTEASGASVFQARKAQSDMEIECEDIRDKVKNLAADYSKVTCWSSAENHVIESGMAKIKGWKDGLAALKDKLKEVKKTIRAYELDTNPLTLASAAVNSAEGELDYIISQIEHEDTSRCLFSGSQTKSANITYPVFSGQDSEDFIKFKKEFVNALRVNRVTQEDKIKKLRENLKGDALKLIPSTLQCVDQALDLLSTVYGDPKRILNNRKDKIRAMGNFYRLEKYGGNGARSYQEAKQMVDWLLTFELTLEDLFEISKKDMDMYASVFNEDLYTTILRLFSARVADEVNDVVGSYKDKLEYLYNHVKTRKKRLIPSLSQSQSSAQAGSSAPPTNNQDKSRGRYAAGVAKSGGGGGASEGLSSSFPLSMSSGFTSFKKPQRYDGCKICSQLDRDGVTEGLYHDHLTDNPVGCPLFASQPMEIRADMCRKARMCFKCLDGDYIHRTGQRHVDCVAEQSRKSKWYFSCNDKKCSRMFLICTEHKDLNKDKLEKTENYWRSKGKSFVHTVSMSAALAAPPSGRSAASSSPSPAALAAYENDDAVTKRIREVAPPGNPIVAPPEGEPLFMFSYAMGKNGPVIVMYDDGCSHVLLKTGIEKKVTAIKLRDGPLVISAAGDTQVTVDGEWAVILERTDGKRQTMIGVCCENLTSTFPKIALGEAHKELLEHAKKKLNRNQSDKISKLSVPSHAGGSPDILCGIKYKNCYPEIVFMMPSGLFIAKLRLQSHDKKTTAVIGGPHKSFNALLQRCNGDSANVMSVFIASLERWRKCGPPSLAGPVMTQEDIELAEVVNKAEMETIVGVEEQDERPEDEANVDPGHEENHDDSGGNSEVLLTHGFTLQCSGCGEDVEEDVRDLVDDLKDQVGVHRVSLVAAALSESDERLSDLKLLIKFMEQGINLEYRCPKCRNCVKCRDAPLTERLSLREEQENEAIKDSVKIDFKEKKIVGKMPLRGDPEQYLSNNRRMAEKILEVQCRKVKTDPEARETIKKAFRKLTDNGYAVEFDKLSDQQKEMILSKECQHWLPWRVVYWPGSVSTPCRCVMDGSTKTPLLESGKGGRCLNDIVMKGTVNTLNLVKLILRFVCGRTGFNADLKQFYNRISLVPEQWNLQRILYKPDLNPDADTVELIITSLIYGVRCVSAMSEQAVLDLADSVRNKNPRLADLLTHARFCDDLGDSDKDKETVQMIIKDADTLLGSAGLEVKGWTVSGSPPNPDLTHDGVSLDIAGMSWYPEIDTLVVKIPPIHFGAKNRGRLRVGTEIFSGNLAELEKFVPQRLTRRQIVSKYSSFFDPVGHFLPFLNTMKVDARKATMETDHWDAPVSLDTRKLWVRNLYRMHCLQGIHFQRAIVPKDAVSLDLELLAAGDAADLKVAGVWGRFLKSNGQYSCQLLIGRSLLCRQDSTVPKEELESMTICSNLLHIVRQSLSSWNHDYFLIGDSVITICWVTSQNKRMSIFHRNRVNQILMHTDVDKILHCKSAQNPSDIGSRPAKYKDEDVGPESYWEKGLPWMSQSKESAINSDILKPSSELRLNNDDEDEYEKGFVIERELEILVRGHTASSYSVQHAERVEKMRERAEFSEYIFLPKFSFKKVVAITSIIFKFVNRLYSKVRERRELSQRSNIERTDISSKFRILPANVVAEFAGTSWTAEKIGENVQNRSKIRISIDEEDVQRSLIYWYSKASAEVKHFVRKETIEKIAVEKEGILMSRSRILDGQRLIQAAELSEDGAGVEIGLNLLTPVIERHSAIALSIAIYIHHEVALHAGYETCFRQSLEHCSIIQGQGLFREIGNECTKCHMVRKKFMEIACGPIPDCQLSFHGPFFTAFVDIDGPYSCYVPGYERQTRNRNALSVKNYLMVFCCCVTKLINIQVIESRNTQSVLEGLTRLGCEQGFPSQLILDQESSFKKIVQEAEIDLQDLNLRSWREYGVSFKFAPVGAHNYIGLVERKIRTVQDCFVKIDLKSQRLHATGLQTLAKLVENHLNNLPLGYSFGPDSNNTPLLKLITPNMLRVGRLNSRALAGPIKLPKGPRDMMNKVEKLYDAFFKVWNIVMIPRLIVQPKWFKSSPEIKVDDVVYFQKVENDLYSHWTVGQVDSIVKSKDNKIRRVSVRYHNAGEAGPRFTDRCVRSLVRLFNIEDSYFVNDLELVEKLLKEINENEVDREPRVQPLRVIKDSSGNYRLNSSNLNNSRMAAGKCDCCCSGHCAMMSHEMKPRVFTVSAAVFQRSEGVVTNIAFPYVKEKASLEDMEIVPAAEYETRDEMFEMLTALEIDFHLIPETS